MNIAVVRETVQGERRVAMTPETLPLLGRAGCEVLIEAGAGEAAGFPDVHYEQKGGTIAAGRDELSAADAILQIHAAGANPAFAITDLPFYRAGQTVIALCNPLGIPQAAAEVAVKGVTLFSLELLPRVARAQAMDVLSSQATVAGYRAVLVGAAAMPKLIPMLTTAGGTIHPAKALVLGAGVAGLQAIATARRLGAVVSAYDVRAAVKEQIESLGARFVDLRVNGTKAEGSGGYAQQMDEEFYRRQREALSEFTAQSDLIVATAAIPGKRAPLLITAEMVAGMAPGAVIVDTAAASGGNCELTRAGETVVCGGVTILGPVNLPAEAPRDASVLFGKNVAAFLLNLVKEGRLAPDWEDEIVRETLVARDGRVVHPRVRQLLEKEL